MRRKQETPQAHSTHGSTLPVRDMAQSSSTAQGRQPNTTAPGRGKDPVLLRRHYRVMKIRQSRITEFVKKGDGEETELYKLCERCRAIIINDSNVARSSYSGN